MPDEIALTNVSLSTRPKSEGRVVAVPSPASSLARPVAWLGAPSPGGLGLPNAQPTPSQMYAPRGIWLDSQRLIVCDSGNHRILIWHHSPTADGQAADVVLGQADFYSEGPACGAGDYARGLHLPTGVIVADGKLMVADAWHHRILVWNQIPQDSAVAPDYAIGQSDLVSVAPNRGDRPSLNSLYWPYGLAYIAGRFYVADTGNRRVLVWHELPERDRPADFVLGQPDAQAMEENRGGPPTDHSFRWPHDIAGDADQLWIADAGNHRVLGYRPHPIGDQAADYVLGQPDFSRSDEWPYDVQGERKLRFPYGITGSAGKLAVADTANNRIVFWKLPPAETQFAAARDVIGQLDFSSFGENHWKAVTHQTLCWPYGISWHGDQIAIADSGNNRVMIWDCQAIQNET